MFSKRDMTSWTIGRLQILDATLRKNPGFADDVVLARLRDVVAGWGGTFQTLTLKQYVDLWARDWDREMPQLSEAQASSCELGVNWTSKTLFHTGPVIWADLVHEMGHVFAAREPIDDQAEGTFFGWEYQLVRQVGADLGVWRRANDEYVVDFEGKSSGKELTDDQWSRMLAARVLESRAHGLLDECMQPLALR